MASKTFSVEAGTSRSKVKILCSVIVALPFTRLEMMAIHIRTRKVHCYPFVALSKARNHQRGTCCEKGQAMSCAAGTSGHRKDSSREWKLSSMPEGDGGNRVVRVVDGGSNPLRDRAFSRRTTFLAHPV